MSEYALRAIQRSPETPGERKRKMKDATEKIITDPPLSTDPEPSRVLLEERKAIANLLSIGSDAEPSKVLLEERERRRRFLPKRK